MQVKKYEAKTMKEALLMIKSELGPDTVILSVKNNARKYGLAGENSVEVTAAISEESLRKKNFATKKMTTEAQKRFQDYGAREQKIFIERAIENKRKKMEEKERVNMRGAHQLTSIPYIQIQEETKMPERFEDKVAGSISEAVLTQHSEERVSDVLSQARRAFQDLNEDEKEQNNYIEKAVSQNQNQIELTQIADQKAIAEINALKQEIESLRGIINRFNQVPQSFVSLHPGAHEGVPFELSFMYEKLKKVGVHQENAIQIIELIKKELSVEKQKKQAYVDAFVAQFILKNINVVNSPFQGKYHVFYGSSGEGKTSTLVKFASELSVRQRKKIAILTTDNKKVGSIEQLKVYAQILNVPFGVIKRPSDWHIVRDKFNQFDHILIDTPDINFSNLVNEKSTLDLLPPKDLMSTNHLVQSLLSKDEKAYQKIEQFIRLGLSDVIFTKLDESLEYGFIYNFYKKYKLPLHSFGIGDSIPEDYELATRERVVDLLFQLTKMKNKKGI